MKNKLPIIITNEAKSDVKGIVAYISLDNKLAGLLIFSGLLHFVRNDSISLSNLVT